MRRWVKVSLVAIVLLGIAVILTLYLLRQDEPQDNQNNQTNLNIPVSNASTSNTNAAQVPTEEENQRAESIRIANVFSERFGTYSSSYTKQNLDNMQSLMTASFFALISQAAATPQNQGIEYTTSVLHSAISQFTLSQSAVVTVETLRGKTSVENDEPMGYVTQPLAVRMAYEAGAWKVADAQWGVEQPTEVVNP